MKINDSEIESKKIVGRLKGKSVTHIKTKGGWNLLVAESATKSEQLLAVGSHIALARLIAKRSQPDIVFTDLNKANHIEDAVLEPYLAQYELLTESWKEAWEKLD